MELLRVVSVSGGKDSTACYLWAIEQFGKDGFRAVFADTGHEHPITINYVKNMAELMGGPPIEIVTADFTEWAERKGVEPTGNPFLDLALVKKRFPSSKARFCTEFLKINPIKEWIGKNRGTLPADKVVVITGLRKDESEARSKLPPYEYLARYDSYTLRPILEWTREQVFEYIRSKGVEPNPLYDLNFARVGCFPCIMVRKEGLRALPETAWTRLEEYERALGKTFFAYGKIPLTPKQKMELADLEKRHPKTLIQGKSRKGEAIEYWKDSEQVRTWKNANSPTVAMVREWAKTTQGGKNLDLLFEDVEEIPSCMAEWGVCE